MSILQISTFLNTLSPSVVVHLADQEFICGLGAIYTSTLNPVSEGYPFVSLHACCTLGQNNDSMIFFMQIKTYYVLRSTNY